MNRRIPLVGSRQDPEDGVLEKEIGIQGRCQSRSGHEDAAARKKEEVDGIKVRSCTEIQDEVVGVQITQGFNQAPLGRNGDIGRTGKLGFPRNET